MTSPKNTQNRREYIIQVAHLPILQAGMLQLGGFIHDTSAQPHDDVQYAARFTFGACQIDTGVDDNAIGRVTFSGPLAAQDATMRMLDTCPGLNGQSLTALLINPANVALGVVRGQQRQAAAVAAQRQAEAQQRANRRDAAWSCRASEATQIEARLQQNGFTAQPGPDGLPVWTFNGCAVGITTDGNFARVQLIGDRYRSGDFATAYRIITGGNELLQPARNTEQVVARPRRMKKSDARTVDQLMAMTPEHLTRTLNKLPANLKAGLKKTLR